MIKSALVPHVPVSPLAPLSPLFPLNVICPFYKNPLCSLRTARAYMCIDPSKGTWAASQGSTTPSPKETDSSSPNNH